MAEATRSRAAPKTRWGRVVLWSVPYLLIALVQALAIRVLAYEAFETDGPSMEPTLLNGDRFVVDKSAFGLSLPLVSDEADHWADPLPGDVVVLRSPADQVDIIKRVIGVPGDRIEIRDDVVYRNGGSIRRHIVGPCEEASSTEDPTDCEVVEEGIGARTWRTSHSLLSPPESLAELVVPEGTVFVLGDHRDRSNDSRNPRLGCIPMSRIRGRAQIIYWSEARARVGTWLE